MALDRPKVLLLGRPKIGKTGQIVRALGGALFWVTTEVDALAPATNPDLNPHRWPDGRCVIPDYIECLSTQDPCGEVSRAVDVGLRGVREGRYLGLALDTLSSLADREYNKITTPRNQGGDGIRPEYGRAAQTLAQRIQPLLWKVFAARCIFIATAHYRVPTFIEGRQTFGGPRLPGKLVELEPSLFRATLKCDYGAGPNGQPMRIFRCGNDPLVYTGDSYGVVEDGMPMDLLLVLQRIIANAQAAQG